MSLGASTIVVVENVTGDCEIPFFFGGDGATIGVPDCFIDDVLYGLAQLQRIARERLQLNLRCGAVRCDSLQKIGLEVTVGRYRLSDQNSLAVFSGGGVERADSIVKRRVSGEFREPPPIREGAPPLEGLECRWNPIVSSRGPFLSLIVIPQGAEKAEQQRVMNEVLQVVSRIYRSIDLVPFVRPRELSLSLLGKHLAAETNLRASGSSRFQKAVYLVWLRLQVLLGKLMMATGLRYRGFNWGRYREDFSRNVCFESYADIYAGVFPASRQSHTALEEVLREFEREGKILYGIHVSGQALVTCYITNYSGRHLHFLDGAGGGLTLAARKIKEKLPNALDREV
jgi:hypothetical protein